MVENIVPATATVANPTTTTTPAIFFDADVDPLVSNWLCTDRCIAEDAANPATRELARHEAICLERDLARFAAYMAENGADILFGTQHQIERDGLALVYR